MSDKFKDWLVTVKKTENLNYLILSLCYINANMKKICKQSELYVKPNISSISAIKPLFKLYNSAPTKFSTTVGVAVFSPISNNITGTHPGSLDMSNVIRQRPISQEEKDKRNNLGLCYYCKEPGHIAIDHTNPTLLATKKQATGTLTGNLIALVLYKPLFVEEKEIFLG